jgi:tetratricopeptide (TPR) repeat protein
VIDSPSGRGAESPKIPVFSRALLILLRAFALIAALMPAAALAAGSEASGGAPNDPGAVSDTDARVAAAAALGERLFKLGRYDEAVAEYRRAYELRADPRLLYHIAECYRELGAKQQSLFYYERYLAAAPDAPERDEVLDKITELEGPRLLRAHPRMVMEADEAAAPRPLWRRWWFWGAVAAVVAGGITAAALAGHSDTAIPNSDLGAKRFPN